MANIFAIVLFFELIADIFAKEYSLHNRSWQWIFALSAYIAVSIAWLFAIKNGSGVDRGTLIFAVGAALIGSVLGLVIYKEQFSKIQIAGICVGLISLLLIFWPGIK